MGKKWESDADRFWAKVDRSGGDDACWLWGGSLHGGYGQFHVGGKRGRVEKAHRFSWELANGPIPPSSDSAHGTCVLHKCDNPPCVNPEHLFLGTQRDNMDDCKRKLRIRSVLRPDDVRAIRKATSEGRTCSELAKVYDVDRRVIWAVQRRVTWRWVS